MRQVTTAAWKGPDADLDPEVVAFRAEFGETSPLDELVRTGAQRMLQSAIETEVSGFPLGACPASGLGRQAAGGPQRLPTGSGEFHGGWAAGGGGAAGGGQGPGG